MRCTVYQIARLRVATVSRQGAARLNGNRPQACGSKVITQLHGAHQSTHVRQPACRLTASRQPRDRTAQVRAAPAQGLAVSNLAKAWYLAVFLAR